jgi:hypothetical protein
MTEPTYADSPYPIRADLATAHRETWARIGRPGTWWTGAERVAIAQAARAARSCSLCAERKAAVSPFSVDGAHDGPGTLPADAVDAIHRIVTDPGRLSKSWYQRVIGGGLESTHYVELIGVTVMTTAIDLFARALGIEVAPLPTPESGEPTRRRPVSARDDGAWVLQVPSGPDGGDEGREIYGDMEFVPNIGRALSLVPAEVLGLHAMSGPHYMKLEDVGNPAYATPGRALDRLQMELVAARVSAINECFY